MNDMILTETIVLHQDDLYEVSIVRDGHIGLFVQLVSFVRRVLPNSDNELEEHRASKVELIREVKVRVDNKLNDKFKADLASAIKEAQYLLVQLQENHKHIEGALRDYAIQVSK